MRLETEQSQKLAELSSKCSFGRYGNYPCGGGCGGSWGGNNGGNCGGWGFGGYP